MAFEFNPSAAIKSFIEPHEDQTYPACKKLRFVLGKSRAKLSESGHYVGKQEYWPPPIEVCQRNPAKCAYTEANCIDRSGGDQATDADFIRLGLLDITCRRGGNIETTLEGQDSHK